MKSTPTELFHATNCLYFYPRLWYNFQVVLFRKRATAEGVNVKENEHR
jgi:hypothetical protein